MYSSVTIDDQLSGVGFVPVVVVSCIKDDPVSARPNHPKPVP